MKTITTSVKITATTICMSILFFVGCSAGLPTGPDSNSTVTASSAVLSPSAAPTTFTGRPSGTPVDAAHWTGAEQQVSILAAPILTLHSDQLPFGVYRPYGIVQFGAAGAMAAFEFDIGNGAAFSLPASSVDLQVALEQNEDANAAPVTLAVASALSSGTGAPAVLTRTGYIDDVIVVGANDSVTVPPFAKTLTVERTPAGTPVTVQVFAFGDEGGNVPIYEQELSANATMDTTALSPDAYLVSVVNNGTYDVTSARIIFGVSP